MTTTLTRMADGVAVPVQGRVFVIEVYGDPVPQGSKKALLFKGRPMLIDDNKPALMAWRRKVQLAATLFMDGRAPVHKHKPLLVGCVFRLDRAATTDNGSRRAGARLDYPVIGHDQDKLTRAVRDAMTGVVYEDDGQVLGSGMDNNGGTIVALPDFKRWTRPGEHPGVTIRVASVATAQRALIEF